MANDLGELLKKKKSAIEEPLNDYDYENKSFEEMTDYLNNGELPMRDNDDTGTVDNSTDSYPNLFIKSEQEDNQEFEQEDNQELEQQDNQEFEQEDNQELEQEDNQEFEQEDNQEIDQEDNQELEQEDNQ